MMQETFAADIQKMMAEWNSATLAERCFAAHHAAQIAELAQCALARRTVDSVAAQYPGIVPAFEAWSNNAAYWDGRTAFRMKDDRRRHAPWSKLALTCYGNVEVFSAAARAWKAAQ